MCIHKLNRSRKKARKIYQNQSTSSLSSRVNKSIKISDDINERNKDKLDSMLKDVEKSNFDLYNNNKISVQVERNNELEISHENKLNPQPSKEIDYEEFTKNAPLKDPATDLSNIKESFRNLEEHLSNFYIEKSSNTVTPVKEDMKLQVTPEAYPSREYLDGDIDSIKKYSKKLEKYEPSRDEKHISESSDSETISPSRPRSDERKSYHEELKEYQTEGSAEKPIDIDRYFVYLMI